MRHDTTPQTGKTVIKSADGTVLKTSFTFRSNEKTQKKAVNRRKRRDRMQAMVAERGLLTKSQVAAILGTCDRTIERLLLLKRFPPPLKFDRYVRWRESEILEWNAAGRPLTNCNQYFKNKAGEME